jgi:hypothetical protein
LSKTTEGEKRKNGGIKSHFFGDEPDGFFAKRFYRVFEFPLLRNAQKRDKNKID